MKWIARVIEKKPLLVVIGVFLFPLFLAGGMYICIFSFAKGEASGWLGFWGSYLGGLISGIFTFAGVYYAFNLQREENKIKEILLNYEKVFIVWKWCEKILPYLDGTRKWDSEHVAEMTAEARDSYNVFISIDPNWYRRFQTIMSDNFQLALAIDKLGFDKVMKEDLSGIESHQQDIKIICLELIEYTKIKR